MHFGYGSSCERFPQKNHGGYYTGKNRKSQVKGKPWDMSGYRDPVLLSLWDSVRCMEPIDNRYAEIAKRVYVLECVADTTDFFVMP